MSALKYQVWELGIISNGSRIDFPRLIASFAYKDDAEIFIFNRVKVLNTKHSKHIYELREGQEC